METLIAILSLVHTLGAAIGAAGITFAEVLYLKVSADGRIDDRERDYIRTTFWALKWGMATVLVSAIALIIAQYQDSAAMQAVVTPAFWASLTLALVVLLSGYELAMKRIPWLVATSFGFAAWWMILILDAWKGLDAGYLGLLFFYLLFAFLSMGAWGYARLFLTKSNS